MGTKPTPTARRRPPFAREDSVRAFDAGPPPGAASVPPTDEGRLPLASGLALRCRLLRRWRLLLLLGAVDRVEVIQPLITDVDVLTAQRVTQHPKDAVAHRFSFV